MKERSLDKIIFPKDGFTKGDVAEYYARIASVMLPHIQNRPLMLQRCPEGIEQECFYQKNIDTYFPNSITRVKVKKTGGFETHAAVPDQESLGYLANLACITPHMWLSRAPQIEDPDVMIFDLNPTGDDFRPVREMAIALRDILALLGLKSYPMTTGSRGLHVSVPLDRSAGFDTVSRFARDVVHGLTDAYPDVVTAEQLQSSRKGSVSIDVTRNAYAQTSVAPYSLRAKPGAPIATPLDWSEVSESRLQPQRYNLRNIFRRLSAIGADPWNSMWKHPQALGQARKTLESWIPTQTWHAVA